ncbi:hypothetical protein SBBP2_1830005 [Burkholderiales bacterium]|nr:hypothetical protein SBBP2_1830005 [Burkholderiales bacterium]
MGVAMGKRGCRFTGATNWDAPHYRPGTRVLPNAKCRLRPARARRSLLRDVAEPWVGLGRRNIKRFGSVGAGHRHSQARGFRWQCAVAKGLRLRPPFPLDGSGRHAGAKEGYEHCAVRASPTYEHWPGIFEARASFHRVKRADARVRYRNAPQCSIHSPPGAERP